ncbi:MAG: hypothetical protein QXY18_04005 [Nitrososphaerota archaeon]
MENKEEIIVIKGDEEDKKHRRFIAILIAILLSIALITYTGVNLIYSPSTITVGVVKPPLLWEQGGDYGTASSLGYATGWSLSTNKTYFSITVRGSPELTVIIDDIFRVVNTTNIASFKVEIATVISGSLKTPTDKITTLKLRFWDGTTPPTSDSDPQVKGVLDLEDAQGTKTSEMTIDDDYDMLKVQIIIQLTSDALTTDYATVQIRFTDIALL